MQRLYLHHRHHHYYCPKKDPKASKELATLLYKLQGSHADMASRMDYLENLLADREMQEEDIERESAEEEREEKKGNGIKVAVSEDEDASD